MHLEILTPERKVYEGEVNGVRFPGIDGGFEILKGHAPVIAALKQGDITISSGNKGSETIQIKSGFVEVLNNQITVLAEGAVL